MVGVPRSRGCLLCVRRRVRCDEGRPGCIKCATYGAECPGYDRSLKFVTGKHQVRKRGQGRDRDPAAGPADASTSSTGASPHREVDNRKNDVIVPFFVELADAAYEHNTSYSLLPSSSAPSTIPPSPRDCRAAFVNTILEMINMDRPPKETLFYGMWFSQLPGRLGRKVTLDSAVCSFAMHLLGKSRGDDVMVMQSRQLYGQSLGALQSALNHPVEWRSSETLCTTMVMCLFELFADTSRSSEGWLQHSSAVAHLIQQRGVDGFVEPWDRAMLFSFRSVIIMNSLFTGRDCFLAKKKWQRLLFGNSQNSAANPASGIFPDGAVNMIDRHVAHLARLPTIMHHGWEIRETRQHGLPVDQAQVAMLQRSASQLHATFRAWYADAAPHLGSPVYTEVPSNVPEDAPHSPYATVLLYPNPWIASVYLSYASSMLIIQESLNQCAAVRAETAAAQAEAEAAVAQTATATKAGARTASSSHTDTSTEGETPVVTPSSSSGPAHSDRGTQSPPVSVPASPGSDIHSTSSSGRSSDLYPDPVVDFDPLPVDPALVPPLYMRPFDASNRNLCRIIFRSFETLGRGLMGQYRIGFSMRVSYEFADVPTQIWIRALLDRSVKTFASSRAETYPPPKPNEFNYN
ncbi:hypothetical protein SEUCBS140593_009306 [Sporothrix eucalyptigena]|uniref:Zn(2)-C6 fungal-type domain-containing protein n=1 Tax=Sporothrix eucalyptigena TaxID=1812306 RepID=A0ABP0CTP6_9PEZI